MRVIAGRARGTRLQVPSGRDVRPTSDRLRESLFAILEPWLDGARVLDLFAGSGALGIEAWSRGAGECIFVDRSRQSAATVHDNLRRCRAPGRVLVRQWRTALRELRAQRVRFDVVFLDPPYAFAEVAVVLGVLERAELLADGALVAVERPSRELPELPPGWERGRRIEAGSSAVTLCRPRRPSAVETGTTGSGSLLK